MICLRNKFHINENVLHRTIVDETKINCRIDYRKSVNFDAIIDLLQQTRTSVQEVQ